MKRKRRTKTRLLPMDILQSRPCEVNGCPALFLRWFEGYTVEGYELKALVEYRDGTVGRVNPERIRFTDREVKHGTEI